MRRIVVAAMSTISGLVLLFSYHTSTNRTADSEAISSQSDSTAEDAEDSQAAGDSAAKDESGDDKSSEKLAAGTYTGASVNTDYGDVQVRITVKKGKITKATAVAYPKSTPRSVSLSDKAVPALGEDAVDEQSAEIDFVTGATSTSTGYTKSLQSAIDKAFA